MAWPPQLAQQFADDEFNIGEVRNPFTATVVTHDGSNLTYQIPSFDDSLRTFGPIPYVNSEMTPGTAVLMVYDENGTPWVIAP